MNELYMQRCLELAENGLGKVAPNPMVGAVLVHQNKIIGEGYHRHFGAPHAEVVAIQNAIEKYGEDILKSSTLYVSLEPCVHHGKTPPCCDLIIDKGIPNVVVGTKDSFEEINGRGIEKLKQAGCNVQVGLLEEGCRTLNRRFFTFHEKKRPYVILKFAQSADGFIAHSNPTLENRWISNAYSRKLVHKWRSEEDAVLVGANTVIADNPELNVRDWVGKNPVRILIDKNLSVPDSLKLFNGQTLTLVFNERKNEKPKPNLEYVQVDFGTNFWRDCLRLLYERNIQSILIEGGAKTLNGINDIGLWDEMRTFISNTIIGEGIPAPGIDGLIVNKYFVINDTLLIRHRV
jgi:diaminohydroxyphosphoribosylaminopyrimidine deaminase / 5-amino-6-(5-phosphoribosylamino)uracil reductase